MAVQERYTPIVIAANTTVPITGNSVGHFICTTSGTLTITSVDYGTLVNALTVTAGGIYPILFTLGSRGGTATTAGGAIGTLGV